MSDESIKNSEVVRRLQRVVDEHGSQHRAAKALGSDGFQSNISNAVNGVRMPSASVRKALDAYESQRGIERPEAAEAPSDTQDTVLFSVIMRLARDTKNTYLYNAVDDDAAMKSAYVQKSAVGPNPLEVIEVTVTLTTTCDK